jgi:ABC-type maltose transport system permease subunit
MYRIPSAFHPTDRYLGLVLVHHSTAVPYCARLFEGHLGTIPSEVDEAGASAG